MKAVFAIASVFCSLLLSAQTLTFTIKGAPDDVVYLTRYVGASLHYADTGYTKNGMVRFDGSKHTGGLYAVYFKNGSYFEFVHDNEVVEMETDTLHLTGNMKVTKSKNNKVFYDYINHFNSYQEQVSRIQKAQSTVGPGSATYDSLTWLKDQFYLEYAAYQKKLVQENKGLLISDMIYMSTDVDLPAEMYDENGEVKDPAEAYNYFMKHYWDHFNLKDPRLVNIPAYHHRLVRYFTPESMIQHPDTIIYYAHWLLSQTDMDNKENGVFQYTLVYIVNEYYDSPYLGMDKIVWAMGASYYCPPNSKAHWMSPEALQKFCTQVYKTGKTLVGNVAPGLILPDTTEQNWVNIHQIDADYTVLFFWNPTCDHCLETMPMLKMLYDQKFKDRNIAVVGVAGAAGEDFYEWKKYIRENNLDFINIGMTPAVLNQARNAYEPLLQYTNLESLNYDQTWDIIMTPMIFVLDKDKKIIYKKLSIAQLEDVMDEHTGHAADPKLFPVMSTPQH
jgi:thiol-disulfide isomerase/thioredoxin